MDKETNCTISQEELQALDRILSYVVDCANEDEEIQEDVDRVNGFVASVHPVG